MPLIGEIGRKNWRVRIILIGITIFLWLGVVLHLFPVWWVLISSVKSINEVYQFPPSLFILNPTFINYQILLWGGVVGGATAAGGNIVSLLFQHSLFTFIKNSFIITAAVMFLRVFSTAFAGYALSKLASPRWSRIMFLFFIGTMLVPVRTFIIPRFLLVRFFPFTTRTATLPFTDFRLPSISLMNSYWGVILPLVYSGFAVLLFKGFFDGIPDELINAARLDGASEIGIFRRIILPLSRPVFAVVAYFSFTSTWNEFLWPFIVLRNMLEKQPLPVILYKLEAFIGQIAIIGTAPMLDAKGVPLPEMGINTVMAMAVVQSIPSLIIFILFREQLMKGVKLKGMK